MFKMTTRQHHANLSVAPALRELSAAELNAVAGGKTSIKEIVNAAVEAVRYAETFYKLGQSVTQGTK